MALALLVTAGIALTAGCSGRGDATAPGEVLAAPVKSFAIVTPEKESDHGWNQQGLLAAQQAADELGIKVEDHSNVGYDNTETILTQVAESGERGGEDVAQRRDADAVRVAFRRLCQAATQRSGFTHLMPGKRSKSRSLL